MSTLARATHTTKELKPAVPAVTEQRVILDVSVEEAAVVLVLLSRLRRDNPIADPRCLYWCLIKIDAVNQAASSYYVKQYEHSPHSSLPTFTIAK